MLFRAARSSPAATSVLRPAHRPERFLNAPLQRIATGDSDVDVPIRLR